MLKFSQVFDYFIFKWLTRPEDYLDFTVIYWLYVSQPQKVAQLILNPFLFR